jgi:dipeptidyl aminopeptidase/acylaminoacyl peptidase
MNLVSQVTLAGLVAIAKVQTAPTAAEGDPGARVVSADASGVGLHPTLEGIFQPPTLLGARPHDVSISASGRFVSWRLARKEVAAEGEKSEVDLWLAAADGRDEPRVLLPAESEAGAQWSPQADRMLVFRDGWIESIDLGGEAAPQPLFECGPSRSRLQFTRDGTSAVFVAGEDSQLWVLDLGSGERFAPASALKERGSFFQVLEEADTIALFAAPSAPVNADAAAGDAARGKAEEAKASDAAGERKEREGDAVRTRRVLWFVPLSGEGPARETRLEEKGRIEVSADGRFAVSTDSEREAKRQLVIADYLTEAVTTVPVRSDLAGDAPGRTDIELWDFGREQAVAAPIDEGDRFIRLDTEWSPTGARLLVHRISADFHTRQILVVDAERGRAWPLLSERDEAWIGGPMLMAEWRRDGAEVVFSSELSGWCHIHSVPAEGGEIRALTQGGFEVWRAQQLDDGRHALLLSNERDPAEYSLSLLDLDSGARRELDTPRGCVESFEASRNGEALAFVHEDLAVPSDVWAIPTRPDADPVQLSDTVTEAYRALAIVPPEIVEFKNEDDGTVVRALLYRPQPFDPGRKVPAVVFVHGAGYLQNVARSMTSYPVNLLFHQRLARLGFAVLDVDYRHSAGYGRKFRTDVHGFMGGKDLGDELAGVRWLGTLGFVDTERVGVYGGSYGGFLTLMALFTKPDVFACGAALRSVTDWRTYSSWYTNPRLGDPVKDAENYRRSSPIEHVEGLRKPLLILHGLKDRNVFAQDSIRLIEKLIQLGKDFDAMLYPSQDHGFTDPESWIDEYRRIERLFVRELRPEPVDPVTSAAPAGARPGERSGPF